MNKIMHSYAALYLIYETGVSNLELEKIISDDSYNSWRYAIEILKGRFELGEKSISKRSNYSFYYAKNILKGKFELGEKIISEDGYYSWRYAISVLKGRFRLGENLINNLNNYCEYLVKILGYDHE